MADPDWLEAGPARVESLVVREAKVSCSIEEDSELCLSRWGGPCALYRQSTREVSLMLPDGRVQRSWQAPAPICPQGMGWTEDQALVMITTDQTGTVYVWDSFEYEPWRANIQLGARPKLACISGLGFVCMTENMSLCFVRSIRACTSSSITRWTLPLKYPPRTLCILQPLAAISESRREIALTLSTVPGMLVAYPGNKHVEERVPGFNALPVEHIVPHPLEPIVACIDVSGRLLVVNSSWKQVLFSRDCSTIAGVQGIPAQMAWIMGCPSYLLGAVFTCTTWARSGVVDTTTEEFRQTGPGLVVLGFTGARSVEGDVDESPCARFSLHFSGSQNGQVPVNVAVSTEVDGLHVSSISSTSLVRRSIRAVPVARHSIFAIGSVSPAALLYSTPVEERVSLELEENELSSAAEELLSCAICDVNREASKSLLIAAQCAIEQLEALSDVRVRLSRRLASLAKLIRSVGILNHNGVSDITPLQARALSWRTVLDRLIVLGVFSVSQATTNIAGPAQGRLRFLAAKHLVASSQKPELFRLSQILFAGALTLPPRFEGASALAVLCQSKEFGLRLNEHEVIYANRVLAQLRLRDLDGALQLIGSWGIDFELRARVAAEIIRAGGTDKVASSPGIDTTLRALFRSLGQVDKLERWLIGIASHKNVQAERKSRASYDRALLLLERALLSSSMDQSVEEASILVTEAARELEAAGRDGFASQAKEYLGLVRTQAELKLRPGRGVCHSISECIALGREDVAEKLRKEFRVNDRFFYKAKARGLGWKNRWIDAARLSLSDARMAQFCSLQDVLEMCYDSGNDAQAVIIASELLKDDDPLKARTFARARMWPETLKYGAVSKSLEALDEMALKCRSPEQALQARRLVEEIRRERMNTVNEQASKGSAGIFSVVAGAVRVAEGPARCQQQ